MTRRAMLAAPLLLGSSAAAERSAARRPVRPTIHWIAADLAGSGRSDNWPDADQAVSMGSLLKPFLALAYLQTHDCAPVIFCSRCWLPGGHGRQDLVAALANSCNTYFLSLAGAVNRAALDRICLQFGLESPGRSWPATRLIGLGEGWPQSPRQVARSFAALPRDRQFSDAAQVLAGMRRCAISGTARAVGLDCYAKTGTGACCHRPAAAGDGYAAVLYPSDSPRRVLLLQDHNTTGAHTAAEARAVLGQID